MTSSLYRIYLVDDEAAIRKAMARSLAELSSCSVTTFASADECLSVVKQEGCDLLISDLNMPGMSGLALLKEVKRRRPFVPVLLLSGYGDIPTAIEAVKKGALDFLQKPIDENVLLETVQAVLESSAHGPRSAEALTDAESEVLRLLAEGMTNKEIAHALDRSIRTVENHRHRLMKKLSVDSSADLVKIAVAAGLASL